MEDKLHLKKSDNLQEIKLYIFELDLPQLDSLFHDLKKSFINK